MVFSKAFRFILFLLILVSIRTLGTQQQYQPAYLKAYLKAESFYNREAATDTDDSLALKYYREAVGLHSGTPDSILWDSYFKAGILYQTKGAFAEAIPYFKNALKVGVATAIPDSLLYLPNLYLGNSYYSISRLDSAVLLYRAAENITLKYPKLEGRERLYNTLGAVNYEAGDYLQSSRYFEKALQVLMLQQPDNINLLVNYKNNIAASFRQLKQYGRAMDMFRDLLKYGVNRDELLLNIGSLHLEMEQPEEAIKWLKKVSRQNQSKSNDLALAYMRLNKHDSAKFYLNQASLLNKVNNGRKNIQYAQTLRYTGDLFLTQRQIDSALLRYQQSIIQLVHDFNATDTRQNPVAFNGQYFVLELFESLLAKAKAFRSKHGLSKNQSDLVSCIDTYRSLYLLIDYVTRNYESDEAKFFLQDKKHLTHNEPIDVAIQLYNLTGDKANLERAFEFDEKNKAFILATQLQQQNARIKSVLPVELLQKERAIKNEIRQLAIGDQAGGASSKRIGELQLQLAQVQKKFDENVEYRRSRYLSNTVRVAELQKTIPGNAAILSYHVGDSSLLIFMLGKNNFNYKRIGINHQFIASLHPLFAAVQNRFEYNSNVVNRSARELYSKLILPFEKELEDVDQLMIIPDDELAWVPYQMLQDENGELLINKYRITYNYSCSILGEMPRASNKSRANMLTMAPFTEAGAFSLPGSALEIANFPGRKLTGAAATKQIFTDSSGLYNIIHLATHAYVNDSVPENSYIQFYPFLGDPQLANRLYSSEIAEMSLHNTKLVVLSACETGSGRLIKGEGLMSLTRAFAYAGCVNTIASLWKADDMSTATICSQLHKYIGDGATPAEALQRATLDYLANNGIARGQKIPPYWAHLRLVGTFDLASDTGSSRWMIVAFVVVFALLLVIYFSRKVLST